MTDSNKKETKSASPVQSAVFLFGVAGAAAMGGFGMMLAQSKKRSPTDFHAGSAPEAGLESGAKLAMRALGRATVYSVGGFSIFCFAVWKLMGVHSLAEFTSKMQGVMPRIPPAKTSTGEEVDWDELFGSTKQAKEKCVEFCQTAE